MGLHYVVLSSQSSQWQKTAPLPRDRHNIVSTWTPLWEQIPYFTDLCSVFALKMMLCIGIESCVIFSDSNKGRHRIRRKLRQDKTALMKLVEEYNGLVPEEKRLSIETILVSNQQPWPWQFPECGTQTTHTGSYLNLCLYNMKRFVMLCGF